MKNLSKQKLINEIIKILKIKTERQLIKIKRTNCDEWDSLIHLNIIFLLEKNIKKKISINELNEISSGKDLIKIIDEN
jgi:acyl carrier protein|tara:strand:- start:86 stop:319 length:234 start_codon:yes stop_codon:yes gene_type:complete